MAWMALILAIVLFVPYLPIALQQSQTLIAGHSLDWTGTAAMSYPLAIKVVMG